MFDIIIIEKHDFLKFQDVFLEDAETTKTIASVIQSHECFQADYKYLPMKDQNFQSKMLNMQKRVKKIYNVETDTKKVFSLLNKLTTENSKKIESQIFEALKDKNLDDSVFLEKLIKYSELSNLYINLISDVIKRIYKDKHITATVLENNYIQFLESISIDSFMKTLDGLDYNDYDQFCNMKKTASRQLNRLMTIIRISEKLQIPVNYLEIYELYLNSIETLKTKRPNHFEIILFDIFSNLELLLKETNILKDISLTNFLDVMSTTTNVCKEINNSKLKFKIQSISEFCVK